MSGQTDSTPLDFSFLVHVDMHHELNNTMPCPCLVGGGGGGATFPKQPGKCEKTLPIPANLPNGWTGYGPNGKSNPCTCDCEGKSGWTDIQTYCEGQSPPITISGTYGSSINPPSVDEGDDSNLIGECPKCGDGVLTSGEDCETYMSFSDVGDRCVDKGICEKWEGNYYKKGSNHKTSLTKSSSAHHGCTSSCKFNFGGSG